MKKIYQVLLASCLVLGVSVITKAQPRERLEPRDVQNVQEQHFQSPPEDTIQSLLYYCSNNSLPFATLFVEGADSKNPALKILSDSEALKFGNFRLRASNVKLNLDPQNPGFATATYDLGFYDNATGYGVTQRDSVAMKNQLLPDGNQRWVIIPSHLSTIAASMYAKIIESKRSEGDSGYTGYLATMIAYPKEVLPRIYLSQSLDQLKQLGLAMMQFTQDHEARLDFDQQSFSKKLTLYLKNDAVFTAPGDSAGITSYNINSNIVGKTLQEFNNEFSEIVAFYLGKDEKLDFHYDGLSPVCFMDGHVKAISPEEAKNLRWKP